MTWYGPNYVEVQTAERTFRSGLIESSWRRTCQADQVNSALSVDGNVFPEPSVRYEDGLAIIEWTAYDKNNSQGFATKGVELLTLSKTFTGTNSNGDQVSWTITEIWLSETITTTRVYPSSTDASALFGTGLGSKTMQQRVISGSPVSGGARQLSISWASSTIGIERRNFNQLDEIAITVGNVPVVL